MDLHFGIVLDENIFVLQPKKYGTILYPGAVYRLLLYFNSGFFI